MAAVMLNEAYVVGLLADLQDRTAAVAQRLAVAQQRAALIDGELAQMLPRLDAAQQELAAARAVVQKSSAALARYNQRVGSLHQEIAIFKRKVAAVQAELPDAPPGDIEAQVRGQLGRLLVEVDQRETEVVRLNQLIQAERQQIKESEAVRLTRQDERDRWTKHLEGLQVELPQPRLLMDLFALRTGVAHCQLFLAPDQRDAWVQKMRKNAALMLEVHEGLRAGKYRLDKHNDVLAGRAVESGEAMYAAVASDDTSLAQQIFVQASDPELCFHHIFNIFRMWCLGLFLAGERRQLGQLLRPHQDAFGLRGAYVQAFLGLALADAERLQAALKELVQQEWLMWAGSSEARGLGVINVAAVALARLGRAQGLAVQPVGPTMPHSLVFSV